MQQDVSLTVQCLNTCCKIVPRWATTFVIIVFDNNSLVVFYLKDMILFITQARAIFSNENDKFKSPCWFHWFSLSMLCRHHVKERTRTSDYTPEKNYMNDRSYQKWWKFKAHSMPKHKLKPLKRERMYSVRFSIRTFELSFERLLACICHSKPKHNIFGREMITKHVNCLCV